MKKILLIVAAIVLTFTANSTSKAEEINLLGAGATFPYPLYSKMFDVYAKQKNVKVNYQAIGSGGGIKQLIEKTVDFGATDAFMSPDEMKHAPAGITHIPTCLGADVITYNLPGNPTLKFTPELIVDIFLGEIKNWNDKRIAKENPGVKFPSLPILVVHRSDGSGTTYIFSDYLTNVSKKWGAKVGTGKSLNWPVGLGGKGNQGVAGLIKQTPGSIGYTELIYALSNKMPVADIKNKAGKYIKPTIQSVSLSANVSLPNDTRVSLTNTDAADGYPISSFTWLIFYNDFSVLNKSEKNAEATVQLIWWMIHEGQKFNKDLNFAPLPDAAVKKAEVLLKNATYKGKKLLK